MRNEFRAATASLEIIQRVDLSRHFELLAVDRIVPALDVDAALIAREPQLADDAGPVGVAETRGAHLHERVFAEYAMRFDNVPAYGRVLAVDVEELGRPFVDLRDRIDEVDELVARLPFQPDVFAGQGVEHQFPCIGIVRDARNRCSRSCCSQRSRWVLESSRRLARMEPTFPPRTKSSRSR